MGVKNADGSVCYIIGVLKAIRNKLNKHDGGTIRLPYTKPLPEDLITEIAVWCYGKYAK